MFLFDVAMRHMNWLAERQSVTAANIANADTPGYRAKDVAPFSAILNGARTSLAATSPLHISLSPGEARASGLEAGANWGTAHSGNTVSLESELMKASGASRMMSLDTGLTRTFHRMLLASVKA